MSRHHQLMYIIIQSLCIILETEKFNTQLYLIEPFTIFSAKHCRHLKVKL